MRKAQTLITAIIAALALGTPQARAQSAAETARFDQLEALFQTATIVGVLSIADCTLSGGTAAKCFKITVVAAPSDHITGPFWTCRALVPPQVLV
jgi:hypothetical protein